MVKVEIIPWDVRDALTGTANAGRSLEENARRAAEGGDMVNEAFGTATSAAAAFDRFWTLRDHLGQRAASTVFHQITKVSDASDAFISMDDDMSSKSEQTVSAGAAAQVRTILEES